MCSIFTAEMYAILKAVTLANQSTKNRKTIICTDSLTAINTICSIYPTNPLTVQTQDLISTISKAGKSVTFLWVPSHCGILGNEKADKCAQEAVTLENIEKLQLHCDVISSIKARTTTIWQNHWSSINTKLRSIEPTVLQRRFSDVNRKEEATLRRLRIGHTLLTHGHLITKQPAPVCDTCNVQVTITHVLTQCQRYSVNRNKFLNSENLNEILKIDRDSNARLLCFLKESNIFNRI